MDILALCAVAWIAYAIYSAGRPIKPRTPW